MSHDRIKNTAARRTRAWMRGRSASKHLVLATSSDARYQVGRHTPLRPLMQPSVLVHHVLLSRRSTMHVFVGYTHFISPPRPCPPSVPLFIGRRPEFYLPSLVTQSMPPKPSDDDDDDGFASIMLSATFSFYGATARTTMVGIACRSRSSPC